MSSTVIIIICVLLIVVAIVQGRLKKPKRIAEIEGKEEEKIKKYSHIVENVVCIKGDRQELEGVCGCLGIKDSVVTFFVDINVKHEDWDVKTRDEKIIIPIDEIKDINVQNGKATSEIYKENLDEDYNYLILNEKSNRMIFKLCNNFNKDFIMYINERKTA